MISLVHYSNKPLLLQSLRPGVQRPYDTKPNGLWISVEGSNYSWKEWCEREDFLTENLVVQTKVELEPNAKVLWLDNDEDILQFHKQFVIDISGNEPGWLLCHELLNHHPTNRLGISWAKVARQFDGLIISWYSWSLRLELSWYYGWDCASGCIWSPRAVKALQTQ